jgi:hypothetical protein
MTSRHTPMHCLQTKHAGRWAQSSLPCSRLSEASIPCLRGPGQDPSTPLQLGCSSPIRARPAPTALSPVLLSTRPLATTSARSSCRWRSRARSALCSLWVVNLKPLCLARRNPCCATAWGRLPTRGIAMLYRRLCRVPRWAMGASKMPCSTEQKPACVQACQPGETRAGRHAASLQCKRETNPCSIAQVEWLKPEESDAIKCGDATWHVRLQPEVPQGRIQQLVTKTPCGRNGRNGRTDHRCTLADARNDLCVRLPRVAQRRAILVRDGVCVE